MVCLSLREKTFLFVDNSRKRQFINFQIAEDSNWSVAIGSGSSSRLDFKAFYNYKNFKNKIPKGYQDFLKKYTGYTGFELSYCSIMFILSFFVIINLDSS